MKEEHETGPELSPVEHQQISRQLMNHSLIKCNGELDTLRGTGQV